MGLDSQKKAKFPAGKEPREGDIATAKAAVAEKEEGESESGSEKRDGPDGRRPRLVPEKLKAGAKRVREESDGGKEELLDSSRSRQRAQNDATVDMADEPGNESDSSNSYQGESKNSTPISVTSASTKQLGTSPPSDLANKSTSDEFERGLVVWAPIAGTQMTRSF